MSARAAWSGRRGELAVALCVLAVLIRSGLRTACERGVLVDLLPREIALRNVPEGEERSLRLVATNAGPESVEAIVAPSCTCTILEPGPIRLPARSRMEIPVRVNTARRPGFNAAHVQLAAASGAVLAQASVTFTAVQAFVFDPPVLLIPAGGETVATRAACLGRKVPASLAAESDDPAVAAGVERLGPRTWAIGVSVTGRPSRRVAQIRIHAEAGSDRRCVGTVAVSVPSSRVGDVRTATVADAAGAGLARAWMLIDTETRCDLGVRSLRARKGDSPAWRATAETTEAGSFLWVELEYPEEDGGKVVEVEVAAGAASERIGVVLPRIARS